MKHKIQGFLSILIIFFAMGICNTKSLADTYDPDATMNYAEQHFYDSHPSSNQCAYYVGYCVNAGGLTSVGTTPNTSVLRERVMNTGLFEEYDVICQNAALRKSMVEGRMSKGDIMLYHMAGAGDDIYCHVVLFNEWNSNGVPLIYGWTNDRRNYPYPNWPGADRVRILHYKGISGFTYNVDAAMQYAEAHYNDKQNILVLKEVTT